MRTELYKWPLLLLVCPLMFPTDLAANPAACDMAPIPYTAKYAITRKDKPAGSMEVVLERNGNGGFSYKMDTRTKKGLLKPRIKQESSFTWEDGLIVPASFRATTKAAFYKSKESVDFDWVSMRATGKKKRQDFDLLIQAGMQDKLTLHLALAQSVCKGEIPFNVEVVTGVLKPYVYQLQATEQLVTPLGRLQTAHVRTGTSSTRKQTDSWHAAETHFLPVKIVYRKEKDVTTMSLVDISFIE